VGALDLAAAVGREVVAIGDGSLDAILNEILGAARMRPESAGLAYG
jgi:hypothetical protein